MCVCGVGSGECVCARMQSALGVDSPETRGVPLLPNPHNGLEHSITPSLSLRGRHVGEWGRGQLDTTVALVLTHRLVTWVGLG